MNLLLFVLTISHTWAVVLGGSTAPPATTTTVSTTTTTTVATTTTPIPTAPPSAIPANTNLAYCLCNVRVNECDVDCCCDSSCTASDRLAFTTCIDQVTPVNLRSCVQDSVIFRNNTPDYTTTTSGSLFCIQADNNNAANYFSIPALITTSESFNNNVFLYAPPYSYQSTTASSATGSLPNSSYYKSGDPILTLYDSTLVLGTLTLPVPLNGLCLGSNPAAYLINEDQQCSQQITNLATQCTSNPYLSSSTYYQGFKVVALNKLAVLPDPFIFEAFAASTLLTVPESNTQNIQHANCPSYHSQQPAGLVQAAIMDVTDLANSSLLLSVVPASSHLCLDSSGVATSCALVNTPTYTAATSSCTGAVVGVKYSIGYNGTEGIASVVVTFTYKTVQSVNTQLNALRVAQTFQTSFYQYNGTAEANVSTVRLSGNPGYVIGLPVMAGRLSTADVGGVNNYVIVVSQNNADWMTMVGGGACADQTDSSNRLPVRFGVNMRSGCYVDLSYANMSSLCNQTQYTVWEALRGPNPPNYVASFANSSVESVGDWVPIFNVDDNPAQATAGSQQGQCNQQLVGLDIQIIYSNVGSRNQPQPRIIGSSYSFQYQSTLSFQCYGPYCQGSNNINSTVQRFNMWSSVSFIDASQPPVAAYGQIPQATARLPLDFFYPFS